MIKLFAALLLLATCELLSLPASAAASDVSAPVVKKYQGAAYISGGIGEGPRDKLEAEKRNYNLKIIMSFTTGEYISDAKVVITSRKNRTVLNVVSEGPWLMTKLPPGNYDVAATFKDKTLNQKVEVPRKGLEVIHFHWPKD